MTERNKEQIYDEEISPLMTQIIALSKKHGIAMLATFSIPTEDDPDLACTTHIADEHGRSPEKFTEAYRVIRRRDPLVAFTITTVSR